MAKRRGGSCRWLGLAIRTLLMGFAIAGCGSEGSNDTTNASSTGSASGGSGGQGAQGGDGGMGAGQASGGAGGGEASGGAGGQASSDCPEIQRGGLIVALSSRDVSGGEETKSHSVWANFYDSTEVMCVLEVVGPCVVTSYPGVQGGHLGSPAMGAIGINGATIPVSLTADPAGLYTTITGDGLLWSGGEPLTFSAPGDDIPGFSQTLTAPSELTLTAPALPATGLLNIDRSAPLTIAWSSTSDGEVLVELSTSTVGVDCAFSPAAGGGQIPVAALQKLAPETGHLGVVTTTGATLTLGSYTVSVHAGTHAVTPAGERVSGPVTFQ